MIGISPLIRLWIEGCFFSEWTTWTRWTTWTGGVFWVRSEEWGMADPLRLSASLCAAKNCTICPNGIWTNAKDIGINFINQSYWDTIRENNVQNLHVNGVKKPVPFYTLDVIISVGLFFVMFFSLSPLWGCGGGMCFCQGLTPSKLLPLGNRNKFRYTRLLAILAPLSVLCRPRWGLISY